MTMTTKPIKDGAGSTFLQRVLDISGTGAGPYLPVGLLTTADGAEVSAENPLPVGGAAVATRTATIAASGSLSAAVELGSGRLVGIVLPAAWTSAAITFSVSADGATFSDLFDDGIERIIAAAHAVPGRQLALPLGDWLSVGWVRVRSGTSAAPVVQAASRALTLVTA